MKKLLAGSAFACSLALAAFLGATPGVVVAAEDGMAIFEAQKCAQCHSVEVLDIKAKTTMEAMLGPDLSEVTIDPDVAAKYLRKQEQIDGKSHKKEVKISDDEMTVLIEWLVAPKS